MANEFNFASGAESIRIKSAIVDSMLPNAFQSLTTNIARNPAFFESVARQLAASYLPVRGVANISELGEQKQFETDHKGIDIALNIDEDNNGVDTDPSSPTFGYLQNTTIIPNLELTSTFIQRNFFDSSLDIVDTTTIQIPIASVSVSYSNKYVESAPIGFAGSIKEDVGSSNYKVNIEGIFIANYIADDINNPDQNRPTVVDFTTICVRNKEVTVNNDWLENKTLIDLSKCVVKSFTLPNDNSIKNVQRFTLQLESDKLIEIL